MHSYNILAAYLFDILLREIIVEMISMELLVDRISQSTTNWPLLQNCSKFLTKACFWIGSRTTTFSKWPFLHGLFFG